MLGQTLRNLRIARGLSREGLVEGQYSVSHLASVEQGSKRPSVRMLDCLCRRLRYPLEKLVPQVLEQGFPTPELLRLARKVCRDGQHDLALSLVRRASESEGVQGTYRAGLLTTEAFVEFARGNYSRSLEIYREVCRVRERGGNALLLSQAYLNIGLVEGRMGDHDKALHWLFMAWERLQTEKAQNPDLGRQLLRAYANHLFGSGQYDLAMSMYERLLSLCQQEHVTDRLFAHWGIGSCTAKIDDLRKAEHHHACSMALAEEIEGGESYLGEIYINLGDALRRQGHYERAVSVLSRSFCHNREHRPGLALHSINEILLCLLEKEGASQEEIARWVEAAAPGVIEDAQPRERAAFALLLARISGLNRDYEEACVLAREAFSSAPASQADIRVGALAEVLDSSSRRSDDEAMEWVASRLRELDVHPPRGGV